jgi:Arc/MetJ-type ribon-helix-helix transcriptional regulator
LLTGQAVSMIASMTMGKIAITLPREVLDGARRAVRRGRAPSMSAYVSSALQERVKLDSLDDLLQEMLDATGGPPTAAEKRWADRTIFGARRKKGRR